MGKTMLYFHISGFIFTDDTYEGTQLEYHIINYCKPQIPVKKIPIEYKDAAHVSRSFHVSTDDLATGKVEIKLYQKSIFDDEYIGNLVIPLFLLPKEAVTMNTLPLIMQSTDVGQVGVRVNLHLTETAAPYKSPIKEPTLIQMDVKKYLIQPKPRRINLDDKTKDDKRVKTSRRRKGNVVVNSM